MDKQLIKQLVVLETGIDNLELRLERLNSEVETKDQEPKKIKKDN